jgi:hypothetical protein
LSHRGTIGAAPESLGRNQRARCLRVEARVGYWAEATAMTSTRASGLESPSFWTLRKYCFRKSAYLASWSGGGRDDVGEGRPLPPSGRPRPCCRSTPAGLHVALGDDASPLVGSHVGADDDPPTDAALRDERRGRGGGAGRRRSGEHGLASGPPVAQRDTPKGGPETPSISQISPVRLRYRLLKEAGFRTGPRYAEPRTRDVLVASRR